MVPIEFSAKQKSEQKARLHDVADTLLAIYETFVHMRYLDAADIDRGPHVVTDELRQLYDELELDPAVVYLYSILPYVDAPHTSESEFFQGGEFADFRQEDDVRQGRDPFYGDPEDPSYDDPNGPYMRPWVTPLSLLGNHQSVILYDTRKQRIWIIDQESWATTDPILRSRGPKACESGPVMSLNENDFRHIPSRPALEVLRDILRLFRNLDALPGDLTTIGAEWHLPDEMDIAALYRQHGWPDRDVQDDDFRSAVMHFDGDAFEADLARWHHIDRVCYDADEPRRRAEARRNRVTFFAEGAKKETAAAKAAGSETEAGWRAQYRARKNVMLGAMSETDTALQEEWIGRSCPGGVCLPLAADLPLWELMAVEDDLEEKRRRVAELHEGNRPDSSPWNKEDQKEWRQAQHELAIEELARERSQSAAEQRCPGRSVEEARQLKVQRDRYEAGCEREIAQATRPEMQRAISDLEAWLATVPEGFTDVRMEVESDLDLMRQRVEAMGKTIDQPWDE